MYYSIFPPKLTVTDGSQALNFAYAAPSNDFYVFIYDTYGNSFTLTYNETDTTALTDGVQANAILSTGSWIYYTYQATGPFTISFTGYQKYVYARFGSKPDSTNYALASTSGYDSSERIISTDACSGSSVGTWYIGVYSASSSSYVTADITVTSTGGASTSLSTLTSLPQSVNAAVAYFSYTASSSEEITVSITPSGGSSPSNFNIYASSAGCPSSSTYTYAAVIAKQSKHEITCFF